MNLYGLSVLLVIFGAALAVFDLLLLALTPHLLRAISRLAPVPRANSVLVARSLPLVAALLLALCVVLPAWLRHEPADSGEVVGAPLAALALLSLLPILQGLRQGARMFSKTRDRLILWRGRGRNSAEIHAPYEVLEVKSADLALCVGGYLRPTIYASTDVLRSLEPDEFSAALAHEVSHASTRDPLRLLWMGSCPDFLRLLRLDEAWRRAFSSACEFAADEGASRGDRGVALDLASALLKVARLRAFHPMTAEALADVAVSSAFSSRVDLEARVRALATPASNGGAARVFVRPWMFAVIAAVLLATGALASERVHSLTEEVGYFLTK